MLESGKERGDAMMRRFPGISIAILILFSAMLFGCTAKQKNTMEIPEGFTGILTYGSLISLQSMEKALGHRYEGPIYEVHLKGYERVWKGGRPWRSGPNKFIAHFLRGTERVPILGQAKLDLSPQEKGRINGVLYLLNDEELLSIDKWERDYQRMDVTDEIEEFSFRGGKVYVYVRIYSSTPSSSTDNGTYIMYKEVFDHLTNACDSRGTAFREEFDRTTRPWEYEIVPLKNIVWEKMPEIRKRD